MTVSQCAMPLIFNNSPLKPLAFSDCTIGACRVSRNFYTGNICYASAPADPLQHHASAQTFFQVMPTDTSAPAAYFSAMWNDLPNEPMPPLLAHYTSLDSIEKILRSGEFWLSNPLYMNDWEELRFGMHAGAQALRDNQLLKEACETTVAYDALLSKFDSLFADFDNTHALDVYVLCLSAHAVENTDGVLSMWRGYGAQGNGVALILDSAAFPKHSHLPLTFGPVVYATSAERIEWLNERVNALASAISCHAKTNQNMGLAAQSLFDRLRYFALFTKHKGFEEESEWRVVYTKQSDSNQVLSQSMGYLLTGKGIEPKLKLKLSELCADSKSDSDTSQLISQILLGPSQSTTLARASIRRMLSLIGHGKLCERLAASGIPFRP